MAVLLGRTSAGANADFTTAGASMAWKFTAVASGDLATIFAQTKVSNPTVTGVRMGVYADGATPGAQLGVTSVVSPIADARGTGVFSAPMVSAVAIVSATAYWLAVSCATEDLNFQGDAASAYSEDTVSDLPVTWVEAGTGTIGGIIWGASADGVARTFTPIPFMR